MEKRLNREIKILSQYNYNDINIDKDNYNNTILTFNIYKFILSNSYPFKPPDVFINDKNYRNLLCIKEQHIVNEIKNEIKNDNKKCLCCTTVLCQQNWNPVKNILYIMNEYKTIRNIILNIIRKNTYKKLIELLCIEKNIPIELSTYISNYL